MPNYDIRAWSEQRVASWLAENQFGHYADAFIENDVNGEVLVELNNTLLKELGVRTVGERVKILVALKRLRQACVNATRRALQDELAQEGIGLNMLSDTRKAAAEKLKQHCIRVSGPDDRVCVVNVQGATDAQTVISKILHKFHIDTDVTKYRLFVTNGENMRMLPDAELLEICHSADRPEKSRLLLRAKQQRNRGQQESNKRKPVPKQLTVEAAESPGHGDRASTFFNDRPPSEMISKNLSDFFPDQQREVLETVNENRIRHTIYRKAKRVTMMYAGKMPSVNLSSLTLAVPTVHDSILQPSESESGFIIPDLNDKRITKESIKQLVDERIEDDELEAFTEMIMNNEVMATEEEKTQVGITQWIKGSMIGTGSFGHVYLGLNPLTGELLAAKQVELPNRSGQDERRERMLEALQREIDLLKDLDHENIVRYLGSQRDDQHLNIFLEYVPGGSVASMLINYGPFKEAMVKAYLRQILLGLEYLHGQGIIHRDIKGGNILADGRGAIKISDFGVSLKKSNPATVAHFKALLSGKMAPEVVKSQHYTPKTDIWSLGCLVVEMFTGDHPFPKRDQAQALFWIGMDNSPEIPDNISEEAQDFLHNTFRLAAQLPSFPVSITLSVALVSKFCTMSMSEISRPSQAAQADTKLKHLQAQADEVKGVMKEAIDEALKRDELLSDIEQKAEHLGVAANHFKKDAKKTERRMWWKDMKLRILIALIVIVILLVAIIVPVVKNNKEQS
ncbi:kinase-like domain-containing protein [Thamnocephalis sphaerospora]|uniref:Kinase-like domain-containing protein n=1 Tax=Thamnocephalis sphaerospora TaxID=78915 RepID=A0A4P9XJY2_9FUNG|nr:kinase-like domain-containing protein [Thamnocephalis sphaerospora]|eukprot:RKP06052.1 kinase-like domain-containing protein [Thamnocephalis sphaerospora]